MRADAPEVPAVLVSRLSLDAWVSDEWAPLKADTRKAVPNSALRWELRTGPTAEEEKTAPVATPSLTSGREIERLVKQTWNAERGQIAADGTLPENDAEQDSPEPSNPTAPAQPTATSWNRFASLRLDEILATPEFSHVKPDAELPTGAAHLRSLAKRDDLVGWNATILLAQRYPQESLAHVEQLARLVTDPPHYAPQTGKRARPPKDESPKTQPTEEGKPTPTETLFHRARRAWSVLRAAEQTQEQEQPPRQTSRTIAIKRPPSRRISYGMQAAAAEAWCLTLTAQSTKDRENLKPALEVLEQEELPLAVYGELMRSLGTVIPPFEIPGLANILRSTDDEQRAPANLRLAALDACVMYALEHEQTQGQENVWPRELGNAERDPDARVRTRFYQWIAVSGAAGRVERIKSGLNDISPHVQQACLELLAVVGTPEAREPVFRRAANEDGHLRLVAVRALGGWGVDSLAEFARDETSAVREAVAEELRHHPNLDAARLIQGFLSDRKNPQTQLRAVESLKDWPDDLAVPLLLHGVRHGLLRTRQACINQLHEIVDFDDPIDPAARFTERNYAVTRFIEKHGLKGSLIEEFEQQQRERIKTEEDPTHIAELEQLIWDVIRPDNSTALSHLSVSRVLEQVPTNENERRRDIRIIENYLDRKGATRGGTAGEDTPRVVSGELASGIDKVYREILPTYSERYHLALELEKESVEIRRNAARELIGTKRALELSPELLRRIRRTFETHFESDRLVWYYILTAIEKNGSEEAAQLARLGLVQRLAQTRAHACKYFARLGRFDHAVWLLPLLTDENLQVQLAAIEAVGQCGNPRALDGLPAQFERDGGLKEVTPEVPGLRKLTRHISPLVRFEAVFAMSRLGDPDGMRQLELIARAAGIKERRQAVERIGKTGQSRFINPLIDLAWEQLDARDNRDDQLRQEILNSLKALVPAEQHPPGLRSAANFEEAILAWVQWRNEQQGNTPADTALRSVPASS